ncbi:hypothetical protein P4O66_017058 [Electrophorus voltai]|uniref:ZP domain-containing protein n=1 Tax=Electrophorus voltai TaxID=2609070 RepID=A0AAD8YTX0_9TELE|nr:hypothetical protein P4O66_017058 [Electrophorus voltai]
MSTELVYVIDADHINVSLFVMCFCVPGIDDFSGVALSTTFSLGSFIPIAATVDQASHQPLILLLEECVASTTPTLAQDGHIHPIITNNGCLMDSKNTNSRFLPRRSLSEIRLYLQAFKFTNAEKVYIHCKLVAWDPHVMDSGKKACQYDAQKGRQVSLCIRFLCSDWIDFLKWKGKFHF